MEVTLKVDGMMCVRCKARVEKALAAVDGVEGVEVSLEDKTAVITGAQLDEAALKNAVTEAGYDVIG